jgi:uncharacterized membrane protein YoaK (UPF0700 family)
MRFSPRSIAIPLLEGVAWRFFLAAGLAFLFGVGVIHAVIGTDRVTAEFEGVALMVLCLAVGLTAKIIEYWLEEGELPASLGEAFSFHPKKKL